MSANFSAAIFKAFFPFFSIIFTVLALMIIIRLVRIYIEKQKLAKLGIGDIDELSGRDFEKYLEILFEKQGYKVTRTRYTGDYGADLVIETGNNKTVIQAKRSKDKVGVKAIQEVVTSKGYYGCQNAMVVTNSNYTDQAIKLALANSVELWGRKKLINELSNINDLTISAHSKAAFDEAFSDFEDKKCVLCGKHISQKIFDYCMNNSDRFKGKYYCFNCQKKV